MRKLCFFSLLCSLLTFGCTSGGSIGTSGSVTGAVTTTDTSTATEGELAMVWLVSSGSPDHAYITGGGSFTATGFELTLPDPLPLDAQNQYGTVRLGVGIITAHEVGMAPPVGRDETDEEPPLGLIGASERFSVIYRDGALPADAGSLGWIDAFPQGYSCGRGVPAAEGETFDSFEPVDCDLVEVKLGDVSTFDFVNWT